MFPGLVVTSQGVIGGGHHRRGHRRGASQEGVIGECHHEGVIEGHHGGVIRGHHGGVIRGHQGAVMGEDREHQVLDFFSRSEKDVKGPSAELAGTP